MRITRPVLACALLCLSCAPGCFESLTSIVTPDKVVYYPDLVGDYAPPAPAKSRLHIAKGEDKGYTYAQYDDKGVLQGKGALRMVKLGEHHFFEITIENLKTAEGRPVYVIGRVTIEGDKGAKTLTAYSFKPRDALFKDPAVGTAEFAVGRDGASRKVRAVSMPPAKLQAYLAAHAKEMSEAAVTFTQTGGK
jgi:hypothetical protein